MTRGTETVEVEDEVSGVAADEQGTRRSMLPVIFGGAFEILAQFGTHPARNAWTLPHSGGLPDISGSNSRKRNPVRPAIQG